MGPKTKMLQRSDERKDGLHSTLNMKRLKKAFNAVVYGQARTHEITLKGDLTLCT